MSRDVKWIKLRNMWGGGSQEQSEGERTLDLVRWGESEGTRQRTGSLKAVQNMRIRRSDGALQRRWPTQAYTGTADQAGTIRKMITFVPPEDADGNGAYAVFREETFGTLQYLAYNRDRTDAADIVRTEAIPLTGRPGGDIASFGNTVVCAEYFLDPYIWTGAGTATFPSAHIHVASWPVAAVPLSREFINSGVSFDPGPFEENDRAWYLCAFERDYTPRGLNPAFQEQQPVVGPCVGSDNLPYVAMEVMQTFAPPGSSVGIRIPTPKWPTGRGITGVRIYRTKIDKGASGARPTNLTEFFLLARVTSEGQHAYSPDGGLFWDNIKDEDLGAEQPYGPPLAPYRAKRVIEHNQRLIFANLKAPRASIGIVAPIPSSGYLKGTWDSNLEQLVVGAVAGINPVDPFFSVDFTFQIKESEFLGEMITRFNREMREHCVANGMVSSVDQRPIPICHMILLGDPNFLIVDANPFNFLRHHYAENSEHNQNTGATNDQHDVDMGSGTGPPVYYTFDMSRNDGDTLATEWTVFNQFDLFLTDAAVPEYPSHLYVTDIKSPYVFKSSRMQGVGEVSASPILDLISYQGNSGRTEILIPKSDRLFKMVGSGIERDGVIDYYIQKVNSTIGMISDVRNDQQQPRPAVATPRGVYFVSWRGVEFFDGNDVQQIALSEDFEYILKEAIENDTWRLNIGLGYSDGRVYLGVNNTTGDSIMFVYDEFIARMLGDPRSAWVRYHHGGAANPSGLDHYLAWLEWPTANGSILLAGNDNAQVVEYDYRAVTGTVASVNGYKDTSNSVINSKDVWGVAQFQTVEPQPEHTVRFRAIRPIFRKLIVEPQPTLQIELRARIRIDDRPEFTIDLTPYVGETATDDIHQLRQPYVPLPVSSTPRGRRIEVTIECSGNQLWTLFGCDIGFVPSRGGVWGRER